MNITIKEIAKLADVSRGTVDRVIHGRPGVKPDIRKKVLAILKDFNYQPNLAGKALVQSRRNIKIGVVLSPDFNPFVEEMKKGIADEAEKISAFGVELDIEVIRAFDSSEQLAVLETLCEKDVSAIAIVPVDDESIRIRINEIVGGGNSRRHIQFRFAWIQKIMFCRTGQLPCWSNAGSVGAYPT